MNYHLLMPQKPFHEWFFDKFVEWEKSQEGRRSNFTKFANYLGVTQPQISSWIKGEYKPSQKYISLIAEKLGNEIYDALDLPRPNPLLQALNSRWDRIPPDKQQKLVELSEQFEMKNDEQQLQESSKPRKKASHK